MGDVTDSSLGPKALELTLQEFGHLDGIVINHGMLPPVTRVGDSEIEAWKHNFDVNFFSAVSFVRTTSNEHYLCLYIAVKSCYSRSSKK